MAQSFLEITTELVIAQIPAGHISPKDTPAALHATYQWLMSLQANAANEDTNLIPVLFNR